MKQSEIISVLRPVVTAFNELKIPYYIGGSIASSTLGMARATMDIDVVSYLSPLKVDQLVEKLNEEYYIDKHMILDAIERGSTFNIIHNETSYKIDVFISSNEEYQQNIFDRIIEDQLSDGEEIIKVFLCSAEDVVLTKLLWYKERGGTSEKQWTDILGVLKVQKNSIDIDYLKKWARDLNILSELNDALKDADINT